MDFKKYYKQKGFTQQTIAKQLNIKQQTVSRWVSGSAEPPLIMIIKMAYLFNESFGTIIDLFIKERKE